MESPTIVCGVSFREAPRPGQVESWERILDRNSQNVQLPTGYGKTYLAAGTYAILKNQGRVNRLLYVVGTQQQRQQFRIDSPADFRSAGVPVKHVVDITFSGANALKAHRKGEAEVFCITVQSMLENLGGRDTVIELMETGRWMVCVDEMHHYGEGRAFAEAVRQLPAVFVLAMSATPHRKYRDGVFGKPDPVVKYEEAAKDGYVKELRLHSYVYRIDTIDRDGDIRSYTTNELVTVFGLSIGPNGELSELDKIMLKRNLRWSPKYVSPLVEIPITRALSTSLEFGIPAQVLIRAMSISHAKLVHNQVSGMFPDLQVEWVGTGEDGKSPEENERIIDGFCPPKNKETGLRRPDDVKVNVLIAVGLAGEGMDSTYLTEVVFLTPANDTNQNRQAIGRASRIIKGLGTQPIGNVNVDSSTELAKWRGKTVMHLMDVPVGELPAPDDKPNDDSEEKPRPLPEEPAFLIFNAELLQVDSSEVRRAGQIAQQLGIDYGIQGNDWSQVEETDPRFIHVLNGLRAARTREAESLNEQSQVERWHDAVKKATQKTAGDAINLYRRNGARIDKTLIGDIKTKINQAKARDCGPVKMDIEVLKRHYKWLVTLQSALLKGYPPTWLQ